MLRPPRIEESKELVELADNTGVFLSGEADELLGGILEKYHDGSLGENHEIYVIDNSTDKKADGWTYLTPSDYAEGVWDVWWIGINNSKQRTGLGSKFLGAIEEVIRERNGRVIIIETSSTPQLEKARTFYPKQGYKECGCIPDFYGSGDDKIIFAKTL